MNRLFSFRLLGLALVPLLLVFSACDSNGDDEEVTNNEFTLDVTSTSSSSALSPKSARDTTLEGFSFFYDGQDPETGEEVFAIYLNGTDDFSQTSAQEGLWGFLARKSSRPSTGTYDVGALPHTDGLNEDEFLGLIYEQIDAQQGGMITAPFYFTESGTITLNESTDNRVSGTLDLSAAAITVDVDTTGGTPTIITDTTDVAITGSFAAQNVENFASVSPATP